MDLDANDWKETSNTYFLDMCLHWDGICIEGNSNYQGNLLGYRGCAVEHTCVADEEKSVFFSEEGVKGGIVGTGKASRVKGVEMRCTSLAALL